MKPTGAVVANDSARCSECERELKDGHWFARIRRGGEFRLYCCPHCVELFLDSTEHPAIEAGWMEEMLQPAG